MDDADAAQADTERMERIREEERASRPVLTSADSADNCVECDEQIPSARQIAVPGVDLCVLCAEKLEQKSANFA